VNHDPDNFPKPGLDSMLPTPDVSSPLDRIEAALAWRDPKGGLWVNLTPEERDALVNVAKAAEYAEDELRKYGTGVHLIGARHRLYDALAALNKEPA
jgi:hypothetical protein